MAHARFGFSSLGSHPYATAFKEAEAMDADFIEFTMNDYGADLLRAERATIKELAGDHGVDLLVHLPHGGDDQMIASADSSVQAASLERFADSLDAAGAIGAEKAVIHVDAKRYRARLDGPGADDLIGDVSTLADRARDHGIELCIENSLGRPRRRLSPYEAAELAVAARASMTLDTGHARVMGYSTDEMAELLALHGDVVSHFHLNDTRRASDEHLPFGAGNITFETLFEALSPDWDGTLTTEVSTDSYDYIAFGLERLKSTWTAAQQ